LRVNVKVKGRVKGVGQECRTHTGNTRTDFKNNSKVREGKKANGADPEVGCAVVFTLYIQNNRWD
jgi:hypothetical protein